MTDSNGEVELNIAGFKKKIAVTPQQKPEKTNPYVNPPVNNFLGISPNKSGQNESQPFIGQDNAKNDYAPSINQPAEPRPEYDNVRPVATNPERESLLNKDNPDEREYNDQDNLYLNEDEEEPDNYAVFEDDMNKIKKFKDEYNVAYEKDKEVDRKNTVQQVKLDQLVEHSNELIDKKDEFKQALLEIMKENARLDHKNKELEEDIKELEDAIEKGIKVVNQDDEEDQNLNLFIVGDPTKLHEMKIERERRKLKRALINALDYMEGKDSKLTGIKEHQSACQKIWSKLRACYICMSPLQSDMVRIRKAYDKSIESFFEMFRFLVNFNIITMFGFAYILTVHILDFEGSLTDVCDTYFPCFMQYTRFPKSAKLRYSLALALFIVIGIIL